MQHPTEPHLDVTIPLILVGEIPQVFTEYLQWKSTWPLSSYLAVHHYRAGRWQPEQNYEALMTFVMLGNLQGIDFSQVVELVKSVRQQTQLLMVYACTPLLDEQQIKALSVNCDNLVLSMQPQIHLPISIPAYRLQKQIHQSNDLIMFNVVEALTQTLASPERGLICVDFADICLVLSERSTTSVASVIESGIGREARLVDKLSCCPMLQGCQQPFGGVYVQIGFGDSGLSMEQFCDIAHQLESSVLFGSGDIAMGARFNKYLMPDELQLTLVAAL